MKKIADQITEELKQAFEQAGYDKKYARVTVSNRPDLCEYQCNGALAAAKEYKKAPFIMADEVVAKLADSRILSRAEVVKPGFINLSVRAEFLTTIVDEMGRQEQFGLEAPEEQKTIIIDYGGPNVAKPLHVGHLRSAVIGESIKRICRYAGHEVIGDVHLGDWGLQIGLIIHEVSLRQPELVYFDENYTGAYPEEAPFTIGELEEIYPTASAKSKEDEEFKEAAMQVTYQMQQGHAGYNALWQHIIRVSVADLKRNYERLNVSFDLWKKESDAQPYIPDMVEKMKADGLAYLDDGALIVDIKEETDTREIPPCVILKSDGAALYTTTDLGTIVERKKLYDPDAMIYLADKRQELHFEQVFRTAKKAGLVDDAVEFSFLGFGTMNGKDGKPFKTRDGGVMRLEYLLDSITEEMRKKMQDNREIPEEEAARTAEMIALAAIKYGDLSNQANKDYIFDIERFTSFEGNTGPYILYTIVRIKSILAKYKAQTGALPGTEVSVGGYHNEAQRALMLELAGFHSMMESACEERAPHKICSYIYDLANAFNRFYHETKILSEADEAKREGWIRLLIITRDVLETCIDLLGFSAPERM